VAERKPPGMTFTSWIDQQISEAEERGAFDDLPGAGKPLPYRGENDDGLAWVREWLRREGVSPEAMLPAPLKLRKESSRLAETVHDLRSEQEVRDVVADLNDRIMEWRKIPIGPPIFVPLVDEENMLSRWRERQPVTAPTPSAADVSPAHAARSARPRWWRRLTRPRDQGRHLPDGLF
jgi:Domain of unknown function (DUF1992)